MEQHNFGKYHIPRTDSFIYFWDYNIVRLDTMRRGKRGRPKLIETLEKDVVFKALRDYFSKSKSIRQIEKVYNIPHSTFYRILKDQTILTEYKEWLETQKHLPYYENPIIKNWIATIRRMGSLSQMSKVRDFKRIIEGQIIPEFKSTPEKFDLTEAQRFVDLYLKHHNTTKVPRHLRMAIRHFLQYGKGISLPRGYGDAFGISGKKDSYGRHAHIRLSDEQIQKLLELAWNDPEAVEEGIALAIEIGIFTGSRREGIISLLRGSVIEEEIEIDGTRKKVYMLRVFEAKTKKGDQHPFYKDGKWWIKPISKQLAEKIREWELRSRKKTGLFADNLAEGKRFAQKMIKKLKEYYKKIGATEEYFYKHPIHALRHVSAHYWLRKTHWNYELVCRICGWDTPQILRDCYGAFPPIEVYRFLHERGAI